MHRLAIMTLLQTQTTAPACTQMSVVSAAAMALPALVAQIRLHATSTKRRPLTMVLA